MPNTFGGKPILDPKFIADRCNERGLSTDWLSLATSVSIPTMEEPGRAYLLMGRADVRKLTVTAEHTLSLTDWNSTYTFQKFTLDRADVVVPGLDDDNAIMLVQAYDRRGRMLKSAFSAAYNLRIGGVYVSSTLNGSSAWTWAGMLSNIWDTIPDTPESAPTLPFTPSGTPEGFDFYGHPSAFTAYCDVLRRIGCVLVYNPIANAFSIERAGATDSGFTTFTATTKKEKLYDSFTVEGVRIPANLKVYFRRSPRPTNGNDPYYTVTVAVSGGNAGTVAVHDELYALGSGTPTNASALTTRANERASDLARRLGAERIARTIRGVWPTSPNALGGKATALEIRDHGGGLSLGLRNQDYGTSRPGVQLGENPDDETGVLDQCRTTINVCPTFKYLYISGGALAESPTTGTGYIRVQDGITVSYRGWCGYLTAASWASDVITFTATGHPLAVGDTVTISGVDPSGYNGTYLVLSVSGDDFTVANGTDPGAYVSGGIVSAPDVVYCVEDPTDCCTGQCDCWPVNQYSSVTLTFANRTLDLIDALPDTLTIPLTWYDACNATSEYLDFGEGDWVGQFSINGFVNISYSSPKTITFGIECNNVGDFVTNTDNTGWTSSQPGSPSQRKYDASASCSTLWVAFIGTYEIGPGVGVYTHPAVGEFDLYIAFNP